MRKKILINPEETLPTMPLKTSQVGCAANKGRGGIKGVPQTGELKKKRENHIRTDFID